jgi:hypothetical protein
MTDAAKLATEESEYESHDEPQNEPQDKSENETSSGAPHQPDPEQPSEEAPDRLSENNAVADCLRAWQITMDNERAKLDEDESDYAAEKEANQAFLAAMPPLSGHQNICDFIACVTQAYMWDIIRHQQAVHFFAAAKLALAAFRLDPQAIGSARRGPGRPRKSPPSEK